MVSVNKQNHPSQAYKIYFYYVFFLGILTQSKLAFFYTTEGFIMPISSELTEELNILSRYNIASAQEGIKVHHTAAPELVAAVKRLYSKGIVTQEDGGYLTDLGIETAEHIQKVVSILK